MISFTWSWFSFFVGIFATLNVAFWGVIILATIQYRKKKEKADAITKSLKDWATSK